MRIRRLIVLFALGIILAVPPLGCKAKETHEEIKSLDVPPDFKKYIDKNGPEKFTEFMLNLGFQAIEVNGESRWGDKYGNELPLDAVHKDYGDFLKVELEKFTKAKASRHKAAN